MLCLARTTLLISLIALSMACRTAGDPQELERLRQEKAQLEAEVERLRAENRRLRGQPETSSAVAQHFANDAGQGTLAGLVPGDFIDKARQLYGQETRMNSYVSAGRRESQYEWELVGGVTLRLSADDTGRIFRIGVVVDTAQPPFIPTIESVTLGKDTFADMERKFGRALWTDLHIWGVQGIYTVAQTLEPGQQRRWRLQFAYQLPAGISPEELGRIHEEVHQHRNTNYLMQFVGTRLPYLVVLEEPH